MTKLAEYRQEVARAYDEYIMAKEGRGISYGEIAYIDGLKKKELDALYFEALEEIEKIKNKNHKIA